MNKYILSKEKTIRNIVYREFRKSKKEFINLLEQQEKKEYKAFSDDLKNFLNKMIDATIKFIPALKPIINRWIEKKINPKFEFNWDLRNDPAVRYLQKLTELHLSQNKGSIWKTTTDEILKILRNWINEWLSYTQIAKQIKTTDPLVFSKTRAELIAVTEVGRAYEFWKFESVLDLQNKWNIVLKKWQTVEDDRVRQSHRQNQRDGYIPLNVPFSWTGDLYAPAKNKDSFRCRCATIYSLK